MDSSRNVIKFVRMKIHYLDPKFSDAVRLSPSEVPFKIRAGWAWRRLSPGFGAAGGTASYSRALLSPSGDEICLVSDRSAGPSPDELEPVEVSYLLQPLRVPFEKKNEAKLKGAVWVAHRRLWACAPDKTELFSEWLDPKDEVFDLLS